MGSTSTVPIQYLFITLLGNHVPETLIAPFGAQLNPITYNGTLVAWKVVLPAIPLATFRLACRLSLAIY